MSARIHQSIESLYSRELPSSRSGALYNAFSYPTKISPETIAMFIASHTAPGELVLDTFGGSGTTGIATLLCDNPTQRMRELAEELNLKPNWGPRKAVIYEIGVLGAFLSKTICSGVDSKKFTEAAHKMIEEVESKHTDLYRAKDPTGQVGEIRHSIWSDFLACSNCETEVSYWDAAVERKPLQLNKTYTCQHCRSVQAINKMKRVTESVWDPLLKRSIEAKKRRITYVYGSTNGSNWSRPTTPEDEKALGEINKIKLSNKIPIQEMYWGDLYRSGYHKGITHIHQLYTRRNLIAFEALWDYATSVPNKKIQNALKLLVLSYNSSHSTLMTRVVVKKGQNDLVLTGAQSGVLYISGLPVEKNLFKGIKRKVKTFASAYELLSSSESKVEVKNSSSTKLTLQDASVDYVFTDPPFGDYIPYAEINQINEAWLGKLTNKKKEAIVSTAQKKDIAEYENLMSKVFSEIGRVLKETGRATVVFHSAKSDIWQALVRSYSLSNLFVEKTNILDKLQGSFKQVVSEVSVKGDPLILLKKGGKKPTGDKVLKLQNKAFSETMKRVNPQNSLKKSDLQRLYSTYITNCLNLGVDVLLDAADFHLKAKGLGN